MLTPHSEDWYLLSKSCEVTLRLDLKENSPLSTPPFQPQDLVIDTIKAIGAELSKLYSHKPSKLKGEAELLPQAAGAPQLLSG